MAAHLRPILVALVVLTLVANPLSPAAPPASAAPDVAPAAAPDATNWCVAGDFNGWNNGSDPMWDNGTHGDQVAADGVFSLDFVVATAGYKEWKVVECNNWSNAHPAANSWLNTSADNQVVRFTIDTNDRGGDAGLAWIPAIYVVNAWDDLPTTFTAIGDFQGWNNTDPGSALAYAGHGLYRLAYTVASAGNHSGRITVTGTWNRGFGIDGRSTDGSRAPASINFSFTTTTPNQIVYFLLDTYSGRVAVKPGSAGTGNWCVAGDFNGWNNASTPLNDNGTGGDLAGGDGVHSLDYVVSSPMFSGWKVVECGNWGVAYPAANSWFNTTTAGQTVKFTFDTNNHAGDAGIPWIPATNIVNIWDDLPPSFTAIGDFQGWNNTNPDTTLADAGHGLQAKTYVVANAGNYVGRITATGTWDRGFGIDGRSTDGSRAPDSINVPFQVFHANDPVQLLLDTLTGRMALVPPPAGGAGHDGIVMLDQLGFDSRDSLYRNPTGPVTTGTAVTMRLRAASNDLTAARVRVYNDRTNVETYVPMALVADDGTYEWWEATVPASPDPTIYWYRFLAVDTPTTAYYEDDPARTGGWGQGLGNSADLSWQLTVYDPSYQTPDWLKNAVVYQIFADRFRDAAPGNNTPAGTFFYNEPGGTIVRSNATNWNTVICDPRAPAGTCPGDYSNNFYGGDLQGITGQLDYLQALGVTALYLNPIFESPSNHKYDTTNYLQVDDNFGGQAAFDALIAGAHARGMHVILDGVFNHTSSDSTYFDRYQRYAPPDGACESTSSIFRAWYFFQPSPTGPCAGPANYTSWFGYDSLPKLNSGNAEVRGLVWANGTASVAPYWLNRTGFAGADGWRLDVAGDVDPGAANDPTNDYWEGFRNAVRAVDPEAYIVGEEWGNASSWLLGEEWDATMNYQYSSAMLSFWRDTQFIDNDHNPGSSAGVLAPLTPTQLDERLQNWMERYPPQAYYAMMNLLGSHDTSRALFMLDENAGLHDPNLYQNPAYDWSDAIARLKGVTLLQFTLPGAPTIYYGDEVGLVGPPAWDGSQWQDDPYNRQPYPWLDQSGTPFYTHLQTAGGQDVLKSHYTLLATTRNAHAALRTGDFRTLLADDAARVYAYGRKLAGGADAAVVILNRNTTAQPVSLDVAGYLPAGAMFVDVLNANAPYTVDAGGYLYVPSVPARGGALLVLSGTLPVAPPPPAGLVVTGQHPGALDLAWNPAVGGPYYRLYRSLVSGGGYTLVATTTGTTYTDTGLVNAVHYYYVVTSFDPATLLESGYSNEAMGIPQGVVGWCNVQWPYEIIHTISTITPTATVYGQVWIDGVTNLPGPGVGIGAQVGYGPNGDDASGPTWTWFPMSFNVDSGNNDEWMGAMLPDVTGTFAYLTRFSNNGGGTWAYCQRSDTGAPNPVAPTGYTVPGVLTVNPSGDPTPPAAPLNLVLVRSAPGSIQLAWDPNTEPDLAGYELYRENVASPGYEVIASVGPAAVAYEDFDVVAGQTYHYYLKAFDTSYNRSAPSNVVTATAEYRFVGVTFRITVPAFTPPETVYVVGDNAAIFGAVWDPGHTPMTQVSPTVWEFQANVQDGTSTQYKYTRGDWNRVEWWGSITGTNNRSVTINYGTTGTQLIDDSLLNWRDLLPVDHAATIVGSQIVSFTVTFNRQIQPASVNYANFAVLQQGVPLSGTWTMVDVPNPATDPVTATQFIFIPVTPPAGGGYYIIRIQPGMTGVGNDGVGLLTTVNLFIGTPTAVDLAALTAQARALPGALVPLALLALVLGGLGMRRVRRRGR